MYFIDPKLPKIQKALSDHKINLSVIIHRRVSNSSFLSIKSFLTNSKIEEILCSEPSDLIMINDDFYTKIANYTLQGYNNYKNHLNTNYDQLSTSLKRNRTRYDKLHKEIRRIFNYQNSFSIKTTTYSTYDLAVNLDISTCTYCNRLYTKTVIHPNKTTRPEFDHWFPKVKYPLLALSFYNLIPSCHICNSNVKSDNDFSLNTHNHPYVDSNINLQFSYAYSKGLKKHRFKLKFKGDANNKSKTTSEAFKLKEIYETHEEEISDLLKIRKLYSKTYLDALKNLLNGNVSESEIYRLAFGAYLEESRFDKRSLSRMKRDILKELGIIK